jgi:hypothetical protein
MLCVVEYDLISNALVDVCGAGKNFVKRGTLLSLTCPMLFDDDAKLPNPSFLQLLSSSLFCSGFGTIRTCYVLFPFYLSLNPITFSVPSMQVRFDKKSWEWDYKLKPLGHHSQEKKSHTMRLLKIG